jgi:hypothetical protein
MQFPCGTPSSPNRHSTARCGPQVCDSSTHSRLQRVTPCTQSKPDYEQRAGRAELHILEETNMGRGILLWLLGVPIPIIILLALIWH